MGITNTNTYFVNLPSRFCLRNFRLAEMKNNLYLVKYAPCIGQYISVPLNRQSVVRVNFYFALYYSYVLLL
jgi:hypothetical protein